MQLQEEIKRLVQIVREIQGIGTYKFPQGGTALAVSIEPDANRPEGTQTEGLEVVITPCSEQTTNPLLNQSIWWKNVHKVILKQWDSKGTTLGVSKEIFWRLTQAGYTVTLGPRVMPHSAIGNIETRNLTVIKELIERRA